MPAINDILAQLKVLLPSDQTSREVLERTLRSIDPSTTSTTASTTAAPDIHQDDAYPNTSKIVLAALGAACLAFMIVKSRQYQNEREQAAVDLRPADIDRRVVENPIFEEGAEENQDHPSVELRGVIQLADPENLQR